MLTIGAAIVLYRPLLALSFNEQKAELLGLRPRATHAALLVLIAAAVIGSFQAVGTLLVFGLLVAPPAAAALFARTVPAMMIGAAALSVFSVWFGLILSYHLGTAASATMALVPVVLIATLARDAGLLKEEGYLIRKVQPVDMFCWTSGVETVALLTR